MKPSEEALRELRERLTREPPLCPTRLPERHVAGEFPMSCYQCHLVADS